MLAPHISSCGESQSWHSVPHASWDAAEPETTSARAAGARTPLQSPELRSGTQPRCSTGCRMWHNEDEELTATSELGCSCVSAHQRTSSWGENASASSALAPWYSILARTSTGVELTGSSDVLRPAASTLLRTSSEMPPSCHLSTLRSMSLSGVCKQLATECGAVRRAQTCSAASTCCLFVPCQSCTQCHSQAGPGLPFRRAAGQQSLPCCAPAARFCSHLSACSKKTSEVQTELLCQSIMHPSLQAACLRVQLPQCTPPSPPPLRRLSLLRCKSGCWLMCSRCEIIDQNQDDERAHKLLAHSVQTAPDRPLTAAAQ